MGTSRAGSPAPRTTIELACAARHDYVPHAAAMLHSVLTVEGGVGARIHFLHGADLPDEDRSRLGEMVAALGGEVDFHLVTEKDVAGLRTRTFLPASHWYRIFLPDLLPGVERVLYLDGDLIVLDALGPLWETDLGEHYLAAVTNLFQPNEMHRPAQLGLPPGRPYFNSGVMLMNLELLRRDGCTRTLIDYAAANAERLSWPEQDALNLVLGDRRLHLHPRWNLMNSILLFPWSVEAFGADAVAEARRDPAIRHFEGPSVNKPWHYLCDRDGRELYLEHRRGTPWPEVEVEGRTLANVLRRWRRGLRARAGAGSR
ncbi:MAG: glycosyltransferase family 8 protein [Solirubrobacterales bacterium]